MSQSTVLSGALVKLYISGTQYPADSIRYTIDYGEQEIYGIDSIFPQEIATTKISVQGSISGFRVQGDGGLQGRDIRSKITQVLYAPYLSLRIEDRKNKIDLLLINQIKVSNEQMTINAKGVVKINFSFKGIIPLNVLDRGKPKIR